MTIVIATMIVCLSLILIVWILAHYGININIKKDTTHREIYPDYKDIEFDPEKADSPHDDPFIKLSDEFNKVSDQINEALFGKEDNDESNT